MNKSEIAKQLLGFMRAHKNQFVLSILLAILGVASGMIPYFAIAGRYKGDVYLCLLVHDGVARIFFENYFCESFNCCSTYGNILYIERDSNADYR